MYSISLPTLNSTSKSTLHKGRERVAGFFFGNRKQVNKHRFPMKGKDWIALVNREKREKSSFE